MKQPFIMFAVNDHLADVNLQSCHAAAQGIWVRMLCVMAQGVPYGHLRAEPPKLSTAATPSGTPLVVDHLVSTPGTPHGLSDCSYQIPANGSLEPNLAQLIGQPADITKWAVQHLENNGVLSRTEAGIIYSRRMVRQYRAHLEKVRRGKEGIRNKQLKRPPTPTPPTGNEAARVQPPARPGGTPPVVDHMVTTPGTPSASPSAQVYNQNQNYIDKDPTPTPSPSGRGTGPAPEPARKPTRAERQHDEALALIRRRRRK